MIIQTWGDALNTTFTGFAPFAVQVMAYLFVALIIFTVGWVAGTFLGKVIDKAFKTLKVDSVLKQAGIEDMFKPVETFQSARIEDSSNAELSSKQNKEAQYRWAGMDESARIAKLKDALYNYDSSISRAGLTPADYEKAAKE